MKTSCLNTRQFTLTHVLLVQWCCALCVWLI